MSHPLARLHGTGARRTTQLVVWVLVGLFAVAAGWSLLNPAATTAPVGVPAPAYTSIAPPVPGDGPTLAAGDSLHKERYSGAPAGTLTSQPWFEAAEPSDLLPASRWDTVGLRATKSGTTDLNTPMMSSLASLCFAMAGWVWGASITAVQSAMSLDLVSTMAGRINDVAASLGSGLLSSGVIGLLAILLAFSVGGLMLKKGGRGAIGIVAAFVIPLAVLQLTLSSISTSSKAARPQNTAAYGLTPAGLAERGSAAVSKVSEGLVVNVSKAASGSNDVAGGGPCEYVYKSLHRAYNEKTNDKSGYTSTSVVMLSRVWQDTFLQSLANAQFGKDVKTEGSRAICHFLETQQDIPVDEQAALAGVTDPKSPFYKMSTDKRHSPFVDIADQHDHNTSLLAWMACDYENGSKGRSGWQFNDDDSGLDDFCKDWKAGNWDGNQWGNDVLEPHNAEDAAELWDTDTAAYRTAVSNLGQESGTSRFTLGLVSLLTSIAYLGSLAMPAIGCLVASAGLGVFLAVFPMTLLLLAIPNGSSDFKGRRGAKMLKLTGSFIISKGVFLVVLALFIQFVNLFNVGLGVS